MNQQLTIMKADLYRHYSIFLSLGKPITAELLKNAYVGSGEKQKTLCEVFDIHNLRFGEKVAAGNKSPASLKRMKITKDKVKAFLHHNYNLSDKQLPDLKSSFISDFEHFLITVQGMCHNTANKYLKILKQVLNMSVDQGWISSSPFSGLNVNTRKRTAKG